MKHLIALVFGMATGAALAALVVYFATAGSSGFGELPSGGEEQIDLSFSAVPEDTILFTNDGESPIPPHPGKVLQLWEPTITETSTLVTTLRNKRGEHEGLGIKFSSLSEDTSVLNGEFLADSVWFVYLPGRGTMLIEQSENYWNFLRDIVAPAHWNSGDSWRGNWRGTITSGPDPLGYAIVHGGSGSFEDLEAEATESLAASAYSALRGPVAVEGHLVVTLPSGQTALNGTAQNASR